MTRLKLAAATAVAREKTDSKRFQPKEIKNLAECYLALLAGMKEAERRLKECASIHGDGATEWLNHWRDLL